ncbi:MAG TPA: beta-galactosidase trimerization domain-containing protein, partial [Capsulimonadaceae bacterium]|nr:beta-galactosidase trimerization domain-containing protein [Capsulimonadaceae bacterium]
QPYDVNSEFVWEHSLGRLGLVLWDQMQNFDTAEGMTNEAYWDWAEHATKKYMLPTAINGNLWGSLNHYRDEEQQKMPQYVGDFYTIAGNVIGGRGDISWNSITAENEALGLIQSSYRDFKNDPNIVSWLEPHGELGHGPQEIFLEYGPVADAGYQRFLKARYGTLRALCESWYGAPGHFRAWSQVKVPELASFLGWGPQALDLTGTWRIQYEPFVGPELTRDQLDRYDNRVVVGTRPAPDDWYQPSFDDSKWPTVIAPGDDNAMFRPKRPAVYRRHFVVPAGWRKAHPHVWLYLWDLNLGVGATVRTWLNGKELPRTTIKLERAHWEALDVSDTLVAGSNLLAVGLPKGFIAYRTYLSPTPPDQYPDLGPHRNAQWVDFSDWQQDMKTVGVRRGMQMIRQMDPNRNITMMNADDYFDGVKTVCEDYGAELHNTGYMSGFYADLDPMLMRGVDMPCSLEPGSPPGSLAEYKKMMGLWFSEGVQGTDYFIHIGDVFWHPDIRAYFEKTQNQIHMFGKYHAPKAQVAILYSSRVNALTGYPWGADSNVNLAGGPWTGGYWGWNVGANLMGRCNRDGLSPADFARGAAAKYKVIIDTNTSIMDENLVRQIERYVENGGTFVTFVQTGRHTPTQMDAWPIARLTGYKVTHIDRLNGNGDPIEMRSLRPASGQGIYDESALATLKAAPANGLSLQPVASDVHNLLLWQDGSVAAGYRRLGKGYIVQLGCKWTGTGIPDRIEPGGNTVPEQALTELFSRLMDWRQIPELPGHLAPATDDVLMRHWVSNNGLYDVWTVWNQNANTSHTVDLALSPELHPGSAYDVDRGQAITLSKGDGGLRIANINLEPGQTRIFLTAKVSLQTAALDWFTLQRQWWRGTAPVPSKPLPGPTHRFSSDLSRNWSWKALSVSENGARYAGATAQDKTWEKMRLGIWSIPDHRDVKHAVFQKTFAVPANWKTGRVGFWLQSWFGQTFMDKGRIWLDGALVKDWGPEGIAGDDLGGKLKAGTTHMVTVEIEGKTSLVGSRGTCWLAWKPVPLESVDLAGDWVPTSDFFHDGPSIHLPGSYDNVFGLRRTVRIPASYAGKNIVFTTYAPNPMVALVVNGHYVRRQHHMFGDYWSLNITPWAKAGANNEIEMVCWDGPGKGEVRSITLEAYTRNYYP